MAAGNSHALKQPTHEIHHVKANIEIRRPSEYNSETTGVLKRHDRGI